MTGPPVHGRAAAMTRSRLSWRDVASGLAILGLLAVIAYCINPPQTASRIGSARIYDGDTLTIARERIRLVGIDAPELKQICQRGGRDYPCGREARDALVTLVGGRAVSCVAEKRDRYRRLLGQCTAGGTALNAALVRAGWAVAYGTEFRQEEAEARARGEGLWAGSFEPPKAWRTRHGDVADLEYGMIAEFLVGLGEAIGLLDTPSPESETLGEEP